MRHRAAGFGPAWIRPQGGVGNQRVGAVYQRPGTPDRFVLADASARQRGRGGRCGYRARGCTGSPPSTGWLPVAGGPLANRRVREKVRRLHGLE